jgi:hypothetical protein
MKEYLKDSDWKQIEAKIIKEAQERNIYNYLVICLDKNMKETVLQTILNPPKNQWWFAKNFDEFAEKLKEEFPEKNHRILLAKSPQQHPRRKQKNLSRSSKIPSQSQKHLHRTSKRRKPMETTLLRIKNRIQKPPRIPTRSRKPMKNKQVSLTPPTSNILKTRKAPTSPNQAFNRHDAPQ